MTAAAWSLAVRLLLAGWVSGALAGDKSAARAPGSGCDRDDVRFGLLFGAGMAQDHSATAKLSRR